MRLKEVYFYLLLLFSVSLSISTAGMEIFSSFIILIFLGELALWQLKFRKPSFELNFNTGMGLLFALFAASCLVSFFISGPITEERALRSLDLRWIPLFFAILYIFKGLEPKKTKIIIFTFMGFIVFTCGYGFFQMLTGIDLVRGTNKAVQIYSAGSYRAAGFFGNPMTYGHNSALWFSFSLFFAFQAVKFTQSRAKKDLIGLLALVITGLGTYASYTRGGWVAAMGAVGFVLVPYLLNKLPKKVSVTGVVMAIAGVLSFMQISPIFKDRLLSIFKFGYHSNQSRMYIWQTHLEIFKDNPLFGVGFNWNSELLRDYFLRLEVPMGFWQFSHAHNHYIQLLAGLGIVGFLIYMSILVKLLWVNTKAIFQQISQPGLHLSLLLATMATQIAFYIGGLTECNFSDLEVRYNFVFVISILFFTLNKLQYCGANKTT